MGVLPRENFLLVQKKKKKKKRKVKFSFTKLMINKLEMYWNNVPFLDKSKFNNFSNDGCMIVKRRKNELNLKI